MNIQKQKAYIKRPNFCDNNSRIYESVTFQATLFLTSSFTQTHNEMQQLEFYLLARKAENSRVMVAVFLSVFVGGYTPSDK
jgi:hypothetical protein